MEYWPAINWLCTVVKWILLYWVKWCRASLVTWNLLALYLFWVSIIYIAYNSIHYEIQSVLRSTYVVSENDRRSNPIPFSWTAAGPWIKVFAFFSSGLVQRFTRRLVICLASIYISDMHSSRASSALRVSDSTAEYMVVLRTLNKRKNGSFGKWTLQHLPKRSGIEHRT